MQYLVIRRQPNCFKNISVATLLSRHLGIKELTYCQEIDLYL